MSPILLIFLSTLLASLVELSSGQGPLEIEPKLVCYYTSWAKDRPDPWAYVSQPPAGARGLPHPAASTTC